MSRTTLDNRPAFLRREDQQDISRTAECHIPVQIKPTSDDEYCHIVPVYAIEMSLQFVKQLSFVNINSATRFR